MKPRSLPSKIPWLVAALAVFAAIYPVTLGEPYHYDTSAYMKTVKTFLASGEVTAFYPTRPVACYALLPLATVLGEKTLRWTMALAFACSTTLSVRLLSRGIGLHAAVAGVLGALLAPPALMTSTHAKEDFIALFFVMAGSLLLMRGRALSALAGGMGFGLAWLTKELMLVLYPFGIGLALVAGLPPGCRFGDLRRPAIWRAGALCVLCFLAAALGVVLAIRPSHWTAVASLTHSPATGQFLGPLSELAPAGIREWRRGLGGMLFFAQALGVLALALDLSPRRKLFCALMLGEAALLAVFLINTTTLHYRHFMWPALFALPLAALVVLRALERGAGSLGVRRPLPELLLYALIAIPVARSLWAVTPAVLLRNAYNPVAEFYRGIRLDGGSPVLLGMDNCMHVDYFRGIECRTHEFQPSAAQAEEFADDVEGLLRAGRSVYLLPDFLASDREGNTARSMKDRFAVVDSESRWYEDYHAMDFGWSRSEARRRLAGGIPGCSVDLAESPVATGVAAPFVLLELSVRCPGRPEQHVRLPLTRGRVMPSLRREGLPRLLLP